MKPRPRSSLAWLVARGLLVLLGLALLWNGAWLALTANLTAGTFLTLGLGVALITWGVRPPPSSWLNVIFAFIGLLVVTLAGFLAWSGTEETATGTEEAVIVLGAAVHGSELSNTLIARLDTALAYHEQNPTALIVVSGGQGPQEDLPEAVAMSNYLLAHGVPAAQVIVEDRATSTEENFVRSKELLDQRLPPGYRVTFVTNEFHVLRAGALAARSGLEATHVASKTPWYFWPVNFLREELALVTFGLS